MLLGAMEKGHITKRQYEGRYCVSDERYISDGAEPVNCDICGRPAELVSEENYFFKLSEFGGEDGPLMRLYRDNPEFVQPEYRMNEVKSFVKSGLRDISVSRKRIKWGIPFPLDAERDDPEQVVYVWYDALTSYLTGIGYAQGEKGSPDFQKYWMGVEGPAEVVHMIGKDILRFHAVYWPAFLMAAGLPLPKTVFAHGWIYYEQDKMSKSKGNVVYPEPIIDALDFFGAPGNDALRYYLLREAPFGQDTSFSYEGLIQRYNSDLANDLGNLASRTLAMLHQFCKGTVPSPSIENRDTAVWHADPLADYACRDAFDRFEFSSALIALWNHVSQANKLIVQNKPWELAKSDSPADQERLRGTLYRAAQALQTACVLLYPVMPTSAERLWKQLGHARSVLDEGINYVSGNFRIPLIVPGTKVGKPEPIFPRLDKAATLAKLDELAEVDRNRDKPKEAFIPVESENAKVPQVTLSPSPQSPAPSPVPVAEPQRISIEDFAKVEMRVGEVKAAEHVPGATKLLKVMVDIGTEVRQLVAGIAEFYQPEKLIGMKVVVVTNLQPRKLRGVESNGMIVAASVGEQGRPVLVTFKEDVTNGARLR
jgi:methionyl-tRNA synthetase